MAAAVDLAAVTAEEAMAGAREAAMVVKPHTRRGLRRRRRWWW